MKIPYIKFFRLIVLYKNLIVDVTLIILLFLFNFVYCPILHYYIALFGFISLELVINDKSGTSSLTQGKKPALLFSFKQGFWPRLHIQHCTIYNHDYIIKIEMPCSDTSNKIVTEKSQTSHNVNKFRFLCTFTINCFMNWPINL